MEDYQYDTTLLLDVTIHLTQQWHQGNINRLSAACIARWRTINTTLLLDVTIHLTQQ